MRSRVDQVYRKARSVAPLTLWLILATVFFAPQADFSPPQVSVDFIATVAFAFLVLVVWTFSQHSPACKVETIAKAANVRQTVSFFIVL